jgi:hypothetical protein
MSTITWGGPRDAPAGTAATVEAGVRFQFARTAAGEAENALASQSLSPPARALLRHVDGDRCIEQCLLDVPGARLADAMELLPPGLLRARSCLATSREAPQGVQLRPLVDTLLALSNDETYFVLTHQAKLRLGLIHGFRMVLLLERCVGPHEQRALALRFIEALWRLQGEPGLRRFERYLRA